LARPFVETDGNTGLFACQVLDNRSLVTAVVEVPVSPENGVVNGNITGQKGGVCNTVIVRALEVALDDQPEISDMIHAGIDPKTENVGVKLVAFGRRNGMNHKIPVVCSGRQDSVFDGQSQLVTDIPNLFYRVDPRMGPFVVNKIDGRLVFFKFFPVDILAENRVYHEKKKRRVEISGFFHFLYSFVK
jgi:hypothetical protein